MKSFSKWVLFIALTLGIMSGLTALPAMAVPAGTDRQGDTYPLNNGASTDLDSGVINGIAVGHLSTDSLTPGKLFVGYTKSNGTRTSAFVSNTQDTRYVSDTVVGVPTAEIRIDFVDDADSDARSFGDPSRPDSAVEGFRGWYTGFSGETFPHPLPPSTGETFPHLDNVVSVVIELIDTGNVRMRVTNTSNYACTMSFLLHMPDTDFRVNRFGSGYVEKQDAVVAKFLTSVMGDSNIPATLGEITGNGATPYQGTVPVTSGVSLRLAEDADTFMWLRIHSIDGRANARDSLSITIVMYPDSGPNIVGQRKVRIFDDTGYYGDNDTKYGVGGSEDSVSMWVLVATAIVRVAKRDSIWTPLTYQQAAGAGSDGTRAHDTVPGATIVYTIVYDNDGNRRADTIEIIDVLDSAVDLYLGEYFNGVDTFAADSNVSGVDTRFVHTRWAGGYGLDANKTWDSGATILEFGLRGTNLNTWNAEAASLPAVDHDSIADSIAAIRIRFNGNNSGYGPAYWTSLQRDQIDEPNYPSYGAALDPIQTVDSWFISQHRSSDSGDIGKINFAVVIR